MPVDQADPAAEGRIEGGDDCALAAASAASDAGRKDVPAPARTRGTMASRWPVSTATRVVTAAVGQGLGLI